MSAAETSIPPVEGIAQTAADPATGQAASAVSESTGGILGDTANALSQSDALISWASYFQALALLFLIVALLALFLWFLKRKGGIKLLTKQGDFTLESRLSLGPKKYLVVVRFLNKRLLLGVTDQHITLLTELPNDEDTLLPDFDGELPPDFESRLDEAKLSAK